MTTPNPPIRGHELINEGHISTWRNYRSQEESVIGGCRCGARPDNWQTMSINAVKRWHRGHKAAIRAKNTAA